MDSKKLFSDRVDNYVKFRPSYPMELISFLLENGINTDSTVCDIGSGTGILSELLLEQNINVIGVEPNDEMRNYSERLLSKYSEFRSIAASAEDTGLSDNSVDIITAAQAFHWFDRQKCRKEFIRILKKEGIVFLIWNRRDNSTTLLKSYEEVQKKFGTDYQKVNHQNIDDKEIKKFLKSYNKKQFYNSQKLDWEGFLGRAMSASYTPSQDDYRFNDFKESLKSIYDKNEKEGFVIIKYITEVFYGKLL